MEIVLFDLGIVEVFDDVDDARDALSVERGSVGEISRHEHVAVVEDAFFAAVESLAMKIVGNAGSSGFTAAAGGVRLP